jgi:hypothetical protein
VVGPTPPYRFDTPYYARYPGNPTCKRPLRPHHDDGSRGDDGHAGTIIATMIVAGRGDHAAGHNR